ncbi:MAG: glycosyltransferase, partial [Cyanobacteriota bacterium SKYGB_h_bin112]|nr:glycosyltransferase [Cyanobacteriota bacterium SKYGB_h_bin112]
MRNYSGNRNDSGMAQQTPAISVNMAVYNAARHLPAAIDSILAQTFTDFEFLIIDDGSTDRSLKILETYAQRDHRIRVTSRENRGIAKTRNELLYQSRGEFIAVMDADDITVPERFALQVEFLRAHPEVVCLGGNYDMIDDRDNLLYVVTLPTQDADIQDCLLTGSAAISHPSAMIRRSALLQVGGYDESLKAAIDLDLWLRLGEVGKLANLDTMLLRYRVHSN